MSIKSVCMIAGIMKRMLYSIARCDVLYNVAVLCIVVNSEALCLYVLFSFCIRI